MILPSLRRSPIYLTIGSFCALFNNVLLIWLDHIRVYYGISVVISAAIMIPMGFALHARFTYLVAPTAAAFARYASLQLCNTPAAWLLLLIIHDWNGLAMMYAAPIITIILFVWNYVLTGWALSGQVGTSDQSSPARRTSSKMA